MFVLLSNGDRRIRAAVTVSLLCLCLAVYGCGALAKQNSSVTTSATTTTAGVVSDGYRHGDEDTDDEYGKDHENSEQIKTDDYPITEWGHVADYRETQQIAAVIKRYYVAAAHGHGRLACSLLYSPLKKDLTLTRTVPEDRYSRPASPRVLPGESCAQVTSRLFERRHRALAHEVASLRVIDVRVDHDHAAVVLGFATVGEEWIPVVREGARWKLHSLLAVLLP